MSANWYNIDHFRGVTKMIPPDIPSKRGEKENTMPEICATLALLMLGFIAGAFAGYFAGTEKTN